MYLLAVRPYLEPITQAYIILNELFTIIFFGVILLRFTSIITLDNLQLASICIKLLLAALALSFLSNTILGIKNIYN